MFDGKRLWTVRLSVERPLKYADGQTRHIPTNLNLGVLAPDCEAAIAAAKALVAHEKNPTVWAVTHQHQVDCEA